MLDGLADLELTLWERLSHDNFLLHQPTHTRMGETEFRRSRTEGRHRCIFIRCRARHRTTWRRTYAELPKDRGVGGDEGEFFRLPVQQRQPPAAPIDPATNGKGTLRRTTNWGQERSDVEARAAEARLLREPRAIKLQRRSRRTGDPKNSQRRGTEA